MPDTPRPYGRPPAALRELAERLERQISNALAEVRPRQEWGWLSVTAYWLRTGTDSFGWADYQHMYVRIVPVQMNDDLCEQIAEIAAAVHGLHSVGRVTGDFQRNLRPLVYAVGDLQARQA
jgi:hypothetical protein